MAHGRSRGCSWELWWLNVVGWDISVGTTCSIMQQAPRRDKSGVIQQDSSCAEPYLPSKLQEWPFEQPTPHLPPYPSTLLWRLPRGMLVPQEGKHEFHEGATPGEQFDEGPQGSVSPDIKGTPMYQTESTAEEYLCEETWSMGGCMYVCICTVCVLARCTHMHMEGCMLVGWWANACGAGCGVNLSWRS